MDGHGAAVNGGEKSLHGTMGSPSIVDCAFYGPDGRRPGTVPLEEAGDLARAGGGFVWIGVREPDHSDLAAVAEEFQLPALAVEDAVKAHQRPKLEVYGDVVFAVVKPVSYVAYSELAVSEIALFIGPGFVVTVRHGPTDLLGRVRRRVDSVEEAMPAWPESILYEVLDAVVDEYEVVVETLSTDSDDLESLVFGGDGLDHAPAIYQLKRDAAQIRRAVVPLGGPLRRLAEGDVEGMSDGTSRHFFRDVFDHHLRAAEALEACDRMLSDMLQADLARASVRQADIALRQNEDMRKISAWAAIAVVPTAIGGIYGMNFEHMPELGWRYSYLVVLAVMVTGCLLLFFQLRKRGWL
ncbi:MAG: magnesium and cobalt transport protein CorA [Acidimicrobiales bacterium]|nr:magnesium and cobalt transport protein CorA [Acidimicrobiales bacterium]